MRIHEISQWEFGRVFVLGILIGAFVAKKLNRKPITKEIKDVYGLR